MPIFTTYDDEDILREAEIESPTLFANDSNENYGQMHQKRPSRELDLDKEARGTEPNTPELEEDGTKPVGDYVINIGPSTNGQSATGTTKRTVDMSPMNTEFNAARPS